MKEFQRQKLGREILDQICLMFSNPFNRTGCRFVILDAIEGAQKFYKDYGFEVLVSHSKRTSTVLMAIDLYIYVDLHE